MGYSEKDIGLEMRATGFESFYSCPPAALPCGRILGQTAHGKLNVMNVDYSFEAL